MGNLILDVFMGSLLIMAIVFCWRLNKRLKNMRQMGAQLSPFVKNFSSILNKITDNVDVLKEAADLTHKDLSDKIPQALTLKDDFDVLLEHSEKIAKRLDQLIEKAQGAEKSLQQTVQRVVNNTRVSSETVAQEELLSSCRPYTRTEAEEKSVSTRQTYKDILPKMTRPSVVPTENANTRERALHQGENLLAVLRGVR